MMLFGIILIWLAVIQVFRTRAVYILKEIKKRDQIRTANLQSRLNRNFIFSERSKIFLLYVFLPFLWIRWIEYTRNQKFQKQLLILVPSLASMLRAGHGIEKALAEVRKTIPPPMSDEILLVLNEMSLGTTLEESLLRLSTRFKSENLNMFVHAIVISRKLGSSITEAIDHISQNIMEKEKLKSQISALTSQGKMQSYIALAMPFMLGFVLQWVSPGYFDSLFSTLFGKCCILYSILSMAVGVFWIHRITHKEYL